MDDYDEEVEALKGRDCAPPALNCGPFKSFSSGSFLNLWRHRRSKLDSCRLILEVIDPIRLGTIMDDYGEVFAVFKDRGHALMATSN
jgi:hypothetical protein